MTDLTFEQFITLIIDDNSYDLINNLIPNEDFVLEDDNVELSVAGDLIDLFEGQLNGNIDIDVNLQTNQHLDHLDHLDYLDGQQKEYNSAEERSTRSSDILTSDNSNVDINTNNNNDISSIQKENDKIQNLNGHFNGQFNVPLLEELIEPHMLESSSSQSSLTSNNSIESGISKVNKRNVKSNNIQISNEQMNIPLLRELTDQNTRFESCSSGSSSSQSSLTSNNNIDLGNSNGETNKRSVNTRKIKSSNGQLKGQLDRQLNASNSMTESTLRSTLTLNNNNAIGVSNEIKKINNRKNVKIQNSNRILTQREKRKSDSEKRRREDLKNSYEELRLNVPIVSHENVLFQEMDFQSQRKKISRKFILEETIRYIKHLKQDNRTYNLEIEKLKLRNQILKRKIDKLENEVKQIEERESKRIQGITIVKNESQDIKGSQRTQKSQEIRRSQRTKARRCQEAKVFIETQRSQS